MSRIRWSLAITAWTVGLLLVAVVVGAAFPALSRIAEGPSGGFLQADSGLGSISVERHDNVPPTVSDSGSLTLRPATQSFWSAGSLSALFSHYELFFAIATAILIFPISAYLLRKTMGNPAAWERRPPR